MGVTKENTSMGPPNPRKQHETSKPRTATKSRRRGKEVVLHSPDASEQEDDTIQPLQRTSKKTTKPSEAPKKTKPTKEKREPTPEEYLRTLKTRPFVQTKWADREALETLRIYDEVHALATNVGLGKFIFMKEKAYQIPTCEFLATLQVDTNGDFEYTMNRKVQQWNAEGLCHLFGFPTECSKTEVRKRTEEPKAVWACIANGQFIPGRSKSSMIRNPAIRYLHKVLAHSFYARKETGIVKADDMAFLSSALKPFLQTGEDGRPIQGSLDDVNLGHVMLQYFLEVRRKLYFKAKKDTQLAIGGVITHILKKCKDKFIENDKPVDNTINLPYLSSALIIGGAVENQIIYNMHVNEKDKVKVLIPNQDLTHLMTRANVLFWPPQEAYYDPSRHPTTDWVSRMKKKGKEHQVEEEEETSEEAEEDEESDQDEIYGGQRYHFNPYDGPIVNTAMKSLHEQNKKLHKWCKWQDRTIHKLKKAVKGLSGQVKALTRALTSKKSGEGQQRTNEEEVEENEDMDVEEEQRRRSYHGEPNLPLAIYEPSRHSSYEAKRRRQRRRRRIRSPSPISSNPSLTLSSEDEDTSGSHRQ